MSGCSRTRPSQARVQQHQAATVREPEGEAAPLRLDGPGAVGARIAALGHAAVRAGDHDAAAHAQVNAELRAGIPGIAVTPGIAGRARPGGVQPDGLALPVRGGEAAPGQRAAQLAWCVRPTDVAVGIVHVHDPPVQRLVSDQAAGRLNLGKLGHTSVLPSRAPSRCTVPPAGLSCAASRASMVRPPGAAG